MTAGQACLLTVLCIQLFLLTFTYGQIDPLPECVCYEKIVPEERIYQTTFVDSVADGSGRLFFSEQRGFIRIIDADGNLLPEPFVNLTDTAFYEHYNMGLYKFAFHPDFVSTQRVYLYYGIQVDGLYYMRASEVTVSASDPNVADMATERVVYDVPYNLQEATHQGGGFLFGPDNYLYLWTGDAGCCDDPFKNGQNKTNIWGAVLRIDVDDRSSGSYGVPADNPFLDEPNTPDEMYAYGVRNSFAASMDDGDRNTGDGYGRIFFGDVGSNAYEEVNLIQAGANFGWAKYEGNTCLTEPDCDVTDTYVPPVVTYSHNDTLGSCVMFGGVYRGCANPDLNGKVIFGDYVSGALIVAQETEQGWDYRELPRCSDCPGNLTNGTETSLIGFGHDVSGEWYVTYVNVPSPYYGTASIYRIVDPNNPGSPC